MNTYLQHPCRYGPKRAKFGRDAGELLLAALLAGQRARWSGGRLDSCSVGQRVRRPAGQLVTWPAGQVINWPASLSGSLGSTFPPAADPVVSWHLFVTFVSLAPSRYHSYRTRGLPITVALSWRVWPGSICGLSVAVWFDCPGMV